MSLLALRIDPYARSARVVRLEPGPEPAAMNPLEAALCGSFAHTLGVGHKVPGSHWLLFEALVHESRADGWSKAPGRFDVGVRAVYQDSDRRGMLWTRDDMPKAGTPARLAIPGFAFLDSRQPGVWWGGVCYLVLYARHAAAPLEDLGFLERTARSSITWEPQLQRPQTSRMRLDVSPLGEVVRLRTLACCATCNAFLEAPKRCGACNRVMYCNRNSCGALPQTEAPCAIYGPGD